MATVAELLTASRAANSAAQSFANQPSEPGTVSDALQAVGGVGLGAVASVGNFLDLPGSSVRDILAGENPFDQWMSPLSSDNRVSGRDLLERYGMRKNRETGMSGWLSDPGEGVRDLLGFGAEVVLDPFGPATKLIGTAARGTKLAAAGVSAAERAHPLVKMLGRGAVQAFDTIPGRVPGYLAKKASDLTGGFKAIFDKYAQGVTDSVVQPMAINLRQQAEKIGEMNSVLTNEVAMTAESVGFSLKENPNLDLNDPANMFAEGSPALLRARRNAITKYAEGIYDPTQAGLKTGDVVQFGDEIKEVEFVNRTSAGQQIKLVDDDTIKAYDEVKPLFMADTVELPPEVMKSVDNYKRQMSRAHIDSQDWGIKVGDNFDTYITYHPRQKSAALSQAEALTGMSPVSWTRNSQSSLMKTLATPGGRELQYKAFADGTVGVNDLFNDKNIQTTLEWLDSQATPLTHADSQVVNKIFPGMAGIRHVEGFAETMGMTGEELWSKMFGDLKEAPLMASVTDVKAKIQELKDIMAKEVVDGVSPGIQPGRGWWKTYTDLRDPSKTYNIRLTDFPMERIDRSRLEAIRGFVSDADYNAIKKEVDAGVDVYSGERPIQKGKPPVKLLIAPTKKAKIEIELNRLEKGLDKALETNPINALEAAHDYTHQLIGRNYEGKIDKWMPELDETGKATAVSNDGFNAVSDTLKGWRIRYLDTKSVVEAGDDITQKHIDMLRLGDDSLQALMLHPEQIEDLRNLRLQASDDLGMEILQDMSIPVVDRHRALAMEAVDHVEKRFKKVFGESSPLVANDYLNKTMTSVEVVKGVADAITVIRKVQDKLPSQYGTGKVTTDPKLKFDPTQVEGITLKEALADGPAGLFAGRVENGTFLERLRQKWVAEGIPGFKQLDPNAKNFKAEAAKQIEEMLTLKAPANTWAEMRSLNEIGSAADLPELSEVLKMTSTLGTWWKAGMLTAPATAVRDGFSSLVNAWAIGDMNPVTAISKYGKKAMDFALGHQVDPGPGIKQIEDYLSQINRESNSVNRAQAFSNFVNARYRHGSVNPNVMNADDARMAMADTEAMLQTGLPEKIAETPSLVQHLRKSLGQTVTDVKQNPKAALNPLNVAGAWTKDASGRRVQRSTSNVAVDMLNGFRTRVDAFVRSMFIMDHLEKTKDLNKTFEMTDYALMNASPKNFTRFEHQYLKPLFPFYSFMRQSIPRFLKELTVNPGGKLGMMVRGTRTSQGDDQGYVPFNLQDTTAIRLGQDQEGNIQYLTSLGLMHEEAVKYAGNALQQDWRGLLQSVVSSSSPAAKWVVEASTNTSLFSQGPMGGRRLDDLDPTLGRLATNLGLQDVSPSGRAAPVGGPMIESIAAASPIARILSSAKIATDTRTNAATKVVRLLSGGRIETVSQEQITRDIRDRVNALQVAAGARPLTIVSGTEKLQEELVARGDLKTAALLEQYGKVLAAQKKELAAKQKEAEQAQQTQSVNPLVDMLQRAR
jgi:hypothetical protein